MIIATAGHVDHGKTTLLQALTGTNSDRLPEEKRRGMTIDLGYAYLNLPDGQVLGFIDVPGHEKLIANMLSGVGGIQHALLVIAADDGVMPQTLEHLQILKFLAIPSLTVALTKADCVSTEHLSRVTDQIIQLLQQHVWQQPALFITSASTGQGITPLRQHLIQQAVTHIAPIGRFRLAIDRCFTVKGSGLVVTGTAFNGQVNTGDTLWLTGASQTVRVRGIHAQNQTTAQAGKGQRIALNISGNIEKTDITRGDWLLSHPPIAARERVIALLTTHLPVQHWQSVHLHHAASHITGRLSLLQATHTENEQLVELVLDTPLYLADNDRLIIRSIDASQTLGGARVLELDPPRRGKRQADYLAQLSQLVQLTDNASADHAVLEWRLNTGSVNLEYFAWARQITSDDLTALLATLDCLVVGNLAISPALVAHYQTELLNGLDNYHQYNPDHLGIGRSRLKRMVLPGVADAVVFTLLDHLLATGQVQHTRGWLHLPHHTLTLTPAEQFLWQQAVDQFQYQPIWVRDLAHQLGTEEKIVRTLLYKISQQGQVCAIVKDRYYSTDNIQTLANIARELAKTTTGLNAATFRDRTAIGRKLAIQILEYFNKVGFTRRKGDLHLLRDDSMFRDT